MKSLTLEKPPLPYTPPVDFNKVKSIKMEVDDPEAPKIWVLYLYGQFCEARQYVIRIWVFYSQQERSIQLERILKRFPHIQIR